MYLLGVRSSLKEDVAARTTPCDHASGLVDQAVAIGDEGAGEGGSEDDLGIWGAA